MNKGISVDILEEVGPLSRSKTVFFFSSSSKLTIQLNVSSYVWFIYDVKLGKFNHIRGRNFSNLSFYRSPSSYSVQSLIMVPVLNDIRPELFVTIFLIQHCPIRYKKKKITLSLVKLT